MSKPFLHVVDKFYGGIVRDDKSTVVGGALNMEEIDIFTNANYFQAEQIVSADSMPASTEIYARTIGNDDTAYGWGKDTLTSAARIVSVASGGATNPSTFSTLFTSADTTNLPMTYGDFKFFKSNESSNNTYLLYVVGTGTTWYAKKYNIGTGTETYASGSSSTSQLTGLTGSFDRPTIKVIFGTAYFCHGIYIASLAKDLGWNATAFTLPREWLAVDIEAVGDASIILCRSIAVNANECRGFWWDLTLPATFEDYFPIPMGGPQWIKNVKEEISIFCAQNGVGKFYKLSVAAKGAKPIMIPGITLTNIATETSSQPISSPKMVSTKDKFLYFGLYKTDKTGIYVIGQLDDDKPYAVLLSRRFATTDYSLHIPYGIIWHGPNLYADYSDNGTKKSVRCSTNNSPTRSSNAVYQSTWLDGHKVSIYNTPDDEQFRNKNLMAGLYIQTYPLPASTAVAASVATDYSSTFTSMTKPSGNNMASGDVQAMLSGKLAFNSKVYSVKITLTSSGSSSPKVVSFMVSGQIHDDYASQ